MPIEPVEPRIRSRFIGDPLWQGMGNPGLRPVHYLDVDAELVIAARHGDRAAFAELVERHHAALLRAWRGSADAAEEAVLVALTNLPSLRDDDAFGAWLCGIGRNLWRREARAPAPLPPRGRRSSGGSPRRTARGGAPTASAPTCSPPPAAAWRRCGSCGSRSRISTRRRSWPGGASIDARPSDAINLALVCSVPILVDESVLAEAAKRERDDRGRASPRRSPRGIRRGRTR